MTNLATDEPLAACHDCGHVGTEDEVKYYWGDDAAFDVLLCFDCMCESKSEARNDPFPYVHWGRV